MKSALQGSQSAVPATKSAHRASQSAVPATKSALQGRKVLCLPRNCTLRFTKCCACREICKRATCSKATTHCTCHEIRASKITTMSKVLQLPRNLHFEAKPLRSLAPVTKSRSWTTNARGVPCACHEKWPPCAKMRAARGHPDFASLHS